MPKVIPKPTLILSLILLTTALGCGDAGPPGAMGEEGPQDKPGPKGEPGTANVIYSEWFSLDEASDKFTYSIISGTTGVIGYTFDAPAITTDIVDRGTVQLYFRSPPTGETRAGRTASEAWG